jgi:hypothetical protein
MVDKLELEKDSAEYVERAYFESVLSQRFSWQILWFFPVPSGKRSSNTSY